MFKLSDSFRPDGGALEDDQKALHDRLKACCDLRGNVPEEVDDRDQFDYGREMSDDEFEQIRSEAIAVSESAHDVWVTQRKGFGETEVVITATYVCAVGRHAQCRGSVPKQQRACACPCHERPAVAP